jgi:protein dithiol:quinone oxidoreductase
LSKQRTIFIFGFLLCLGLMAAALYFQYVMKLEPCPLCIIQRLFVIGAGVVLLAGALHNPKMWGRRIYGILTALLAASGAAVATRHVWLQSLPPDQVPECGPGLDYMLQAFPFTKTLQLVLRGSGECAKVDWTFFGLSIPAWTLIFFCGFIVLGIFLMLLRDATDTAAPTYESLR